jgi:hypothetical protein
MSQPNQPPVTPNNMPGANPQMAQPVSTEPPPTPPEVPKETAPQTQPTQQEPAKQPEAAKPDGQEPTDWKSHAKTWEDRARANQKTAEDAAEKARQWDEYQATLRTKEENDRIAIEQANRRAELAEAELLRERIARETGVLPALLGGGTEEEMRAAAALALEWRGGAPEAPPPPQTAAVPAQTVTAADKLGHAPNQVKQLTRDEFSALGPAERMAAVRAGQCADLGVGVPKQQRRMGNQLELGAHAAQQR